MPLETTHRLIIGDARCLPIPGDSVHLVVTSPPYPMIGMWDDAFGALDPAVVGNDVLIAELNALRLPLLDERDLTVAQNAAIADAQDLVDAAAENVDGAQEREDEALLIASNGRTLSDEAIAYIRSVLNL